MRLPTALLEVAHRQRGLFTRGQARGAGVADSSLRRWVSSGRLTVPAPKVLGMPTEPDSRERRWRAHALSVDPGAILCRATAAAVHGLPLYVDDAEPTHVLMHDRSGTAPAGAVLHRTASFEEVHRVDVEGLPVTTVARTVVDLAASVSRWQLDKVLRHAVRHRLTHATEVRATLRAAGPVSGTVLLREILDQLHPRESHAASALESAFLSLARKHDLEPTALNVDVIDAEGRARVIDAVYLPQRVAVELDGRTWHGLTLDRDADLRRQNALVLAGWTVLRFTWTDVTLRQERVIQTLRTALRTST